MNAGSQPVDIFNLWLVGVVIVIHDLVCTSWCAYDSSNTAGDLIYNRNK
jgi:hypothetical protein